MHIAYLTAEYPHPQLAPAGGIGTFLKNLAQGLAARGQQVSILLLGQPEERVLTDQGVKIYCFTASTRGLLGFYNGRKEVAQKVRAYIKDLSVDLIEAPDFEGWHAFLKPGIPMITRLHGSATYFSSLAGEKPSVLLRWLEGKAMANSAVIVPVTDFAGQRTGQLFDLSAKRSVRIYYGIDTLKYSPVRQAAADRIVLYYGTLVRKKGVYDLPAIFNKVFKQDPAAQLYLAGKDTVDVITGNSTWKDIEALFDPTKKKNVTYTGAVAYEQMQTLIARSKVCLFPSMAETFGLVTAEAMAMEKPVVVYDRPWVREILDNEVEGFLVAPNDVETTGRIICELLEDPVLGQKVGRAARQKIIAKFSIEKAITQNLTLYQSIIKAGR